MNKEILTKSYQNKQRELTGLLKKQQKLGNLLVGLKLVLFACSIWGLYKLFGAFEVYISVMAMTAIVGFVVVYIIDYQLSAKIKLTQRLIEITNNEILALKGQYSQFDCGAQYVDSLHDYSFDLDIFATGGLFQAINRTTSTEGMDTLAQWMKKSDVAPEVIINRQQAIKELAPLIDWRIMMQALPLGNQLSLKALVNHFEKGDTPTIKRGFKPVIYALISITAIAFLGNIMGIMPYGWWVLLFCTNLLLVGIYLKTTNKIYHQINGHYKIVAQYVAVINCFKKHKHQFKSPLVLKLADNIFDGELSGQVAFKQLEKLLSRFDQRSNVLVSLFFNGFMLSDLMLLLRYEKWVTQFSRNIENYARDLGELDALLTLSGFAYNHPDYCYPAISANKLLHSKKLGHPLIAESERVCNDFEVEKWHEFYITTGANMAGKSTFLRTVGINMVLAALGAPVCASVFEFQPCRLFTSMRTSDNLVNHVSYFQAELLRLKRVVDIAQSGSEMFVILDEILKGTNSKDKLAGSQLFLTKMLHYRISGIIATHDLALGELANEYPQNFHNVCFEVDMSRNELVFDYKLLSGLAQNMNATWLLNKMLA